jgi:Cytochrome C oxidase, cbb3-type, subunit III
MKIYTYRRILLAPKTITVLLSVALLLVVVATAESEGLFHKWRCRSDSAGEVIDTGDVGGSWHWLRSPEEEKRVVIGLYSRYCIRCHGVDGRGIWDIPDVPDFTNARWQSFRSDGQLVRATLEGRGPCMPPFRGTITLDEGWAMARYLRTFMPGTEVSRPQVDQKKAPETQPPKK